MDSLVAMGRTLSDIELDFFEEFDDQSQEIEWQSDDEERDEINSAETKAFWVSQHQLLQVRDFLLPSQPLLISVETNIDERIRFILLNRDSGSSVSALFKRS